jgi:hypothetical protein
MDRFSRTDSGTMADMLDRDDVAVLESHVRQLTEHTLEAARERAACERTVAQARAALDAAQRELPAAERNAKERRQSQNDAIRGRADLEHRLAELVESEDLTRARRQQAEQRAQSFRAAAAFATTGRTEAEAAGDAERAERERTVEDRATREAAAAEARATEELAEETKVARHRAEIETHVEAERALEAEIAADRASAEARVVELREIIEREEFALHEAEVNLQRLDADRDRLAEERAAAGEKLREIGDRARGQIEARIATLREQEAALANERIEQERLLYILLENDRRIEQEAHEKAHQELEEQQVLAAAEDTVAEHHEAESEPAAEHPDDSPQAADASAAQPHFSTVTFTASPSAPRDPARSLVFESDDDRGPGFRSIIGNIFTRRKAEEPVVDEGPSIAERIARDFGMLGESDEEDDIAAAPSEHALASQPPEAHP